VGPAAAYEIRSNGPSLLSALVASWVELSSPGASARMREANDPELRTSDIVLLHLPTGRRLSIFGAQPDGETISRHLSAGADSLIGIDASREELSLALRSLVDGPAFVSANLVRTLATSVSGARAPAAKLSAREIEVVRNVAAGLSNREIAEQLFLSPNTVRSHLQSASSKLGVSSRAKLVFRARELGVI
jgi:DNA-binding NarL/FixJ family response regulator